MVENEPQQTSWLAFRDALHRSPTSWVPPCILPSPNPSLSENGLFSPSFISPSCTSSLLFCWNGVDRRGSSGHLVDSCTSKIPVSTKIGAHPFKRRGIRMRRCQWDGKKEGKTNDDVHRGSLLGRTRRTSHTLGPPLCFPLPKSFVERA